MENCKANHVLDRSSHQRCYVRKDVIRNYAKFAGKHLRQSNNYTPVNNCSWMLVLSKILRIRENN